MTPPAILGAPDRRRLFTLLIIAGLGQAALAVTGAFMLGVYLTDASTVALAVFVLSGIGLVLLRAGARVLSEHLGQAYVAVYRVRLVKALVRNGGATGPHGVAMTRLITDLASIKNWVSQGLAEGAANTAALIGLVLGAWVLAPAAALPLLASTLVTAIAALALARPLRRAIRASRRARGQLASEVGEMVLTAPTLRIFGALDAAKQRIYRKSDRMGRKLGHRFWWASLMRNTPELGFLASLALIAAPNVVNGAGAGGSAPAAGVLMLAAGMTAQRALTRALDQRLNYVEATDRLSVGLAAAGHRASAWTEDGPTTPLGIDLHRARVVSTARRASFTIPPGATVALRRGKATTALARLICGIGAPTVGALRLCDDAENHRAADKTNLAAVLVAPDAPLIRGDIRSNLKLSAPQADDAELAKALQLVNLVPNDTDPAEFLSLSVGEAGAGLTPQLSARLRLARAVLARPGVLVIDDPHFEPEGSARAALSRVAKATEATLIIVTNDPAPPAVIDYVIETRRNRLRFDPAIPAQEPRRLQVAAQ
jgi:ABC-type transport system involved in cytochrome bd biosynthesis fused ATPase/permease subunit